MSNRDVNATFKLHRFPAQLAIFGIFTRVVQILAILAALSLNNIFTTSAQIIQLIPTVVFIIGILLFVGFAEIQSQKAIDRIDYRLTVIYNIFGSLLTDSGLGKDPPREHLFLRQVFLPLAIYLPSSPFTSLALIITTPYLFLLSLVQAVVNIFIVWHFNKCKEGLALPTNSSLGEEDINMGDSSSPSYLYRHFSAGHNTSNLFKNLRESEDSIGRGNSNIQRKRLALSLTSTIFRAIFLATSAVLAIYKLSSLSSIVGFFILNNTFKSSIIALAEYTIPVKRYLNFKQACLLTNMALQDELFLIKLKEDTVASEVRLRKSFTERYSSRISRLPFLRFKDFSLAFENEQMTTIVGNLTGRIELTKSTIIFVKGSKFASELKSLIVDRKIGRFPMKANGKAVCSSMPINAHFLSSLPIFSPWDIRLVSTSLIDSFEPSQKSTVQGLVDKYRLDQYYFEDDYRSSRIEDIGKRQQARMCALISLIDILVNGDSLALSPFALNQFDEGEALELLQLFGENSVADQKCIFLTTCDLKSFAGYRCYELSRSSLKRLS